MLATAAMVLRNAVLLAILAPLAFLNAAVAFVLMALPLESPFSVTPALRFGLIAR